MISEGDWFIDVFHFVIHSTGEKRYWARIRTINTNWRRIGHRAFKTHSAALEYGQKFCRRLNRFAKMEKV